MLPRFELSRRLLAVLLFVFAATAGFGRERLLLDFGWKFQLGDPAGLDPAIFAYPEVDALERTARAHLEAEPKLVPLRRSAADINAAQPVSFAQSDFDDRSWRSLDLPHDWAVELPFNLKALRNHGYKDMGAGVGAKNSWAALEVGQSVQDLGGVTGNTIGWYRRTFDLGNEERGGALWLEFDGVYRNCLVWLNGRCIGRNVSGYSSFKFDLAPYANYGGKNVLVVRVDATRTEGWFYEGAGIYRHTWLVKTAPLHVAHWGTFVTTELADSGGANVTAATTLRNDGSTTAKGVLLSRIQDASGAVVAETTSPEFEVSAGTELTLKPVLPVKDAKLWSPETPTLYRLISEVRPAGATRASDVHDTSFGIRTVRFDPAQGFFLNGKKYVIRGIGVHHDHAGVGAAVPDAVQEFRIRRLKEMGVNTYRTAHHPHSPAIMEACDRLGMLVVDENRRFDDTPETLSQVERLIRRDRNHPSVVLWSLGNEEFADKMQGEPWGEPIARKIQTLVKTLDPSRPTMMPMNGDWGKGFSHIVDVMGFNYLKLGDADKFHADHPHIPAISSEESSAVSTRGIYIEDRVRAYVPAYANKVPPWGSANDAWFPYYEARPWVAGVLLWAAFDWRGEQWPYDWPAVNCQFGVLDTCGFPKDSFYFCQAWWSEKPVLHLLPHWNWAVRDKEPIMVRAYTNHDEVELFLNDQSQGRRAVPRGGYVEWPVIYQAGVLRAEGYRGGKSAGSARVETTGPAQTLTLISDRGELRADGEDCAIVTVSALDAEGRIVPTAMDAVEFEIKGPGKIIGVGNGDPSSHESDKGSRRSLFNGYAQVIVQTTKGGGPITLIARAPERNPATLQLNAAAVVPRPAAR
ncbi:beta-galactosidase [Nibricoccus aquaticus]|uniref:Beta-galactosidase n=1 Tax=Nibricoccus aquaticus TaxID=2576891 RepID=A0A290QE96_9BACT|nr:beta-galactosidase GalA [Nibricoccus aquaticus]ATC65550.1 beta-galactosidase [Nibricoccus aquaticus]